MAYRTRKTPDAMLFALVAAWNAKQEGSVSTFFHADKSQLTTARDYRAPTVATEAVASAASTDNTTAITMVNEIKAIVNRHFVDAEAHNTAVSAVITTAAGTDLTTNMALANAIKTAYGTHLSASNVHFTNDSTNTIAAANATDQTTLNTLLNELKTDLNAHIASAPIGSMIKLVDA